MPLSANFYYSDPNIARIAGNLGTAIYGDPEARMKRGLLDAEATKVGAETGKLGEEMRGIRMRNDALGGIGQAFQNMVRPLDPGETQQDRIANIGAYAGSLAQSGGPNQNSSQIAEAFRTALSSQFALGGEADQRRSLVLQGEQLGPDTALTLPRADEVAGRNAKFDFDQAMAVQQGRNQGDIATQGLRNQGDLAVQGLRNEGDAATQRVRNEAFGVGGGRTLAERRANILHYGDPASPEYNAAYTALATPFVAPDGTRRTPDMRPFRMPAQVDQMRMPGQPAVSPGGLRAAQQMIVTMRQQIGTTKAALAQLSSADRAAYQGGVTTEPMANVQAAYNFTLSQLRDPSLLNTGVLQAGELAWIEKFMAAPGTLSALVMGDGPTIAALDQIFNFLEARRQGFSAIDQGTGLGPAGPAAAPAQPLAPPAQQQGGAPVEGQIYEDDQGIKARYQGGQWVEVP